MIYIHDFMISIEKYSKNQKDNDYPFISECPHCHDHIIKNGFYRRYVVVFSKTYIIYIQRLRCKYCGKSISIIPSFLIPYFQRNLDSIFQCLREYILNRKSIFYRRAVFFYLQRFRSNIPGIISFFRDKINQYLSFGKRKTIKLIEMIKDSPVPTFSQRFYNHFNKSFMAL